MADPAVPVTVVPKPQVKSWSNWINVVLVIVGGLLMDPNVMQLLYSAIGPKWPGLVVVLTAIINIVRAQFQTGPLAGSVGEKKAREAEASL